ncbi:HNH endonuclease family protein [Geodermatophilus sp. SYSU D01105]
MSKHGQQRRSSRRLARTASLATAMALFLSVLTSLASPAQAATSTARALLSKVSVAAESWSATYDRARFTHWSDDNRDCQDTRAEVLIAESRVTPRYTTTRRCAVLSGRWISPYDGVTWTLASDVDIDHRVALKEAWESGARSWSAADRQRFANDLSFGATLEAVTDNVNSSKGDRDPAQWLPPLASNRCDYAIKWVQVKYRWRMSMDTVERNRLNTILTGSCGAKVVTIPARAR